METQKSWSGRSRFPNETRSGIAEIMYIFDYDDTLKSEEGMCPDDAVFVELVNSVKRRSAYPLVILTAGLSRAYETMYTIDRAAMRPVDYVISLGLSYTENTFDIRADVCIFDVRYRSEGLSKEFGHPLVDSAGRKNLASLGYIIFGKCQQIPDMVFFDDLGIHSIESKKTRLGFPDPSLETSVLYIKVKRLGRTKRESCERLIGYTKLIETSTMERKNREMSVYKFRGKQLPIRVV